jgi:glycosyltransferase involved in cell wall biosynthesis
MGITVVIPTYNRCSILSKVLDGLSRQTTPEYLHEVIIVNDGSSDSTHQVAEQFSSSLPIRYLEQAHSGVSAARNLGLREAATPIVLFLDDDVVPSPQLIYEHNRFHEERTDLKSVLLGYVTWHSEMVITPFMRWYGEFGALFRFSLLKNDQLNDPRYLYTCNLSFKAAFLRSCGGLNESLSVMEDHELGFRLRERGMRMYFRRAAIGYHYQSFTFEQACQRLERYSTGLGAFLLTDAGREMVRRRKKPPYSLAEAGVKMIVPTLAPLRFLLDSKVRLPNAIYRMFYWYYGTYLAFWSRVEQ